MTVSRDLFPEIEPFNTGFIKVSDLHTIYYEEVGNPDGKPVVFLHGGPGGGIQSSYRQYFDPDDYHVILFDQRGCGKSTPYAELRQNTTWDLVSDIEKLRSLLNIEKWLVFGGSWGTTLGLSYAIRHPQSVLGLILLDLVGSYYKRLTSTDETTRLKAAQAWSIWEGSTSRLIPDPENIQHFEDPEVAVAFARIECHYFINKAFMPSRNFLLDNAPAINHIPTRIIQGRYDVICPAVSAWQLKQAMPSADLRIVPDAGHSMMEIGVRNELIQATEDFKTLFH